MLIMFLRGIHAFGTLPIINFDCQNCARPAKIRQNKAWLGQIKKAEKMG